MAAVTDRRSSAAAVAPPAGLPRLIGRPLARSLDDHVARLGPLPGSSTQLVALVEQAGLRGRGGAGFPTATKLAAVAEPGSRRSLVRRRPVVVANGTEGEPISVKDVTLLSSAPHLVLDGIELAARAVGADEAILCVDRAHGEVHRVATAALAQRQSAGIDRVPLRIEAAPTGYVTGEESALVHWLNGGDAVPTTVPPRPYERGVAARPTLVDNVETLAHIGLIARFGPEWWRSLGTTAAPGSFLATVTVAGARPRVYELPFGVSLGAVLRDAGADAWGGVLIGGYFGTWLRAADAASVALAPADLAALGASIGCGAIVALPVDVCPLLEVARVSRWLADQSAGQCGPCAEGLPAIATAVQALAQGRDMRSAQHHLARWLPMVAKRGACRLPDGATHFVSSALDAFADHVDDHLRGRCGRSNPARVLPAPVTGTVRR